MNKKRGLGRGLGALIQDESETATAEPGPATGVRTVPVQAIQRNPLQPRRSFDDEPLQELAASIRAQGLLQPLLVRAAAQAMS
jgi:ParB family transcriptional regulator, chromosome partitioning protein